MNNDVVKSPKHYLFLQDVDLDLDIESIHIIAASLTSEEWRGFCLGNALKYRLRCGKKDDIIQEIGKAEEYTEVLFNQYKHLNRGPRDAGDI